MQRIVANLHAAGLIERDPHPELGRVLEVRLSDRGRRVLMECHRRVHDVEARMVADLSPLERRQLAELRERCTRALRPPRRHQRQETNSTARRPT